MKTLIIALLSVLLGGSVLWAQAPADGSSVGTNSAGSSDSATTAPAPKAVHPDDQASEAAAPPAAPAPADRCFDLSATVNIPTDASVDAWLSFPLSGLVKEVLVRQGDWVKKGQPLIRLDGRVQRAEVMLLEAQAQDTVRIEAAQAQLENARVNRDKVQQAHDSSQAASELELREAKLEVEIKELSLQLAEFEHLQDQRKYEQAKAVLELMELTSPSDGVVEQLKVREGESSEGATPAVRLANVDPLWIDVPVLLEAAEHLKVGQAVLVGFDRQCTERLEGHIIHVASVAAVGKLTVRIELANPQRKPAGARAWVAFDRQAGANVAQAALPDGLGMGQASQLLSKESSQEKE